MKINTRNILIAFLFIMSLTSYVFLSSIEVNEPVEITNLEMEEEDVQDDTKLYLPDLTIVHKLSSVLKKAVTP